MKILSADQTREADRVTIESEPIASIDLMERAAKAVVDRLQIVFEDDISFVIFCGKGNNGGDGLAIARQLMHLGFEAQVIIANVGAQGSPDFERNVKKVEQIDYWNPGGAMPNIKANAVCIDALLGTGLKRPLEGFLAQVVKEINSLNHFVLAIDMPTGLFADDNGNNDLSLALRADATFTFQAPKRAQLHPLTAPFCGFLEVLDIGLDAKYIESVPTTEFWVDEMLARELYTPRNAFGYKNNFGHSLLCVGSQGQYGAGLMAANSSLRSGTGLLTCHIPNAAEMLFQHRVPESMVSLDEQEKHISTPPKLNPYAAIGVGPGIGTHEDTARFVQNIIRSASVPLVFDADALRILAENKTWLSFVQQLPILTPHPGEFEQLSSIPFEDDQLEAAKDFAVNHHCVLVLKGAPTAVVLPNGSVYHNSSGNVGLATGGSGDVLLGLITSLRAQGYGAAEAAILGVYIHGRAADLALEEQSEESMLATDLHNYFGSVFKELNFLL